MKLKKRLPESRNQKRERLASERERRLLDRTVMLDRREAWLAQQERTEGWQRTWKVALTRRLESDAAYAHFEQIHRDTWDYLRHIGLPSTEFTLTVQRLKDGKDADAEPLLCALERDWHDPRRRYAVRQYCHLLKRCTFSVCQRERLRIIVLAILALPYWHLAFRRLCQLVRIVEIGLPSPPEDHFSPLWQELQRHRAQAARMRLHKK